MADMRKAAQPVPPASVMGELKSEVAVEAAPLLQFITNHMRLIVACVLVLIAIIAATGGYQWYQSSQMKEAHLAMGKILTGVPGKERIAALEACLPKLPASMQDGGQLEVAMEAMAHEDYRRAAEAFAKVGKNNSGPLGMVAVLNQSDMLLRAGDAAQALAVVEPLENKVPDDLRLMVLETIAVAAEAAGNAQRAIAAYKAILSKDNVAEASYYTSRIQTLEAAK